MTDMDDSTAAEHMLKIGIYRILNLETGKMYIGSTTTSFKRRWSQHRKELEKGTHPARHLQNSWNKRGPAVFVFEILEDVDDPERVIAREQEWIERYFSTGILYNTSPTAGSTRGFRYSDESKERMSASKRAFYRTPAGRAANAERVRKMLDSEEWRKAHKRGQVRRWSDPENHIKASEAQRKANGTPERRAEFSARMKRHWTDPQHRERLLAHNRRIATDPEFKAKRKATVEALWQDPEHQRRHAEGQRRRFSTDEGKMQASQARRPRDEHGRPITYNLRGPDGTIYLDIPNVAAFCREHGLTTGKITSVLRGETRRSEGWTRYDPSEHEQGEE